MSDLSGELVAQISAALGRVDGAPGAAASSSAAPVVVSTAAAAAPVAAEGRWSKITGVVNGVDPATRQLSLKDKSGKLESFTLAQDLEVTRNKTKAAVADIRPGDKVKLMRYDSATHSVQRIVLSNP
jgi:Cu/Ag efflux protein CusF